MIPRTVYVDMDGVLVDFLLHAVGRPGWPTLRDTNGEYTVPTDAFWKGLHTEFWHNLLWTCDGRELWNFLIRLKTVDIRILSAAPEIKHTIGVAGKRLWCERNLETRYDSTRIIHRYEKPHFAMPGAILIDDYSKNITEWEAAGGIGIKHENAVNTIAELRRLCV